MIVSAMQTLLAGKLPTAPANTNELLTGLGRGYAK